MPAEFFKSVSPLPRQRGAGVGAVAPPAFFLAADFFPGGIFLPGELPGFF